MLQSKIIVVVLVTLVSVCRVQAQSSTNITCQTATGLTNINATLLAGKWFEEIRAPAKEVSCVRVDVNIVNNQTQLNVTTNYAASKEVLKMDKYLTGLVDVSQVNNANGFNVTYNQLNTTYKILSTDYNTNVVLCGYTNFTDSTSSFGAILTRDQIVNSDWLMQLKTNSSKLLTGFNDTSAAIITQSKSCTNSAANLVPTLATFLALFYTLLKVASLVS